MCNVLPLPARVNLNCAYGKGFVFPGKCFFVGSAYAICYIHTYIYRHSKFVYSKSLFSAHDSLCAALCVCVCVVMLCFRRTRTKRTYFNVCRSDLQILRSFGISCAHLTILCIKEDRYEYRHSYKKSLCDYFRVTEHDRHNESVIADRLVFAGTGKR